LKGKAISKQLDQYQKRKNKDLWKFGRIREDIIDENQNCEKKGRGGCYTD
jgi:hypothetical protein